MSITIANQTHTSYRGVLFAAIFAVAGVVLFAATPAQAQYSYDVYGGSSYSYDTYGSSAYSYDTYSSPSYSYDTYSSPSYSYDTYTPSYSYDSYTSPSYSYDVYETPSYSYDTYSSPSYSYDVYTSPSYTSSYSSYSSYSSPYYYGGYSYGGYYPYYRYKPSESSYSYYAPTINSYNSTTTYQTPSYSYQTPTYYSYPSYSYPYYNYQTSYAIPTCYVSVSNNYPPGGQPVTLYWSSTNATYAYIGGIGGVPTNGSMVVTPTRSTTYEVTFTGSGGSRQCYATVNPGTYIGPVTPEVTLSQIPYTGLDLGPVGTLLYWLAVIFVALSAAYAVVVKNAHKRFIGRVRFFLLGDENIPRHPAYHVKMTPAHAETPAPSLKVPGGSAGDDFIATQIARHK